MKLTVLGSNATYPTPGRPASGYLVENDGKAVLLDAGPGTALAMLDLIEVDDLSAIVISHGHSDHCSDISAVYFRLRYGPEVDRTVPLLSPVGVFERLQKFLTYHGGDGFRSVFDERTVGDGDSVSLIGLDFSFRRTDHSVPCVATRIEGPAGAITYTSDTGPNIDLRSIAMGADVLMAEATFQGDETGGTSHLTARWAGQLAADSGVERLVLTHINPELEAAVSVAEAASTFNGPTEAAFPGMVLEL